MLEMLVRTWGYTPAGIQNDLFSTKFPLSVARELYEWAIEHQQELLIWKYDRDRRESAEIQEIHRSWNDLFLRLQGEGYNSSEEVDAMGYFYGLCRDNPEWIDFKKAIDFLERSSYSRAS